MTVCEVPDCPALAEVGRATCGPHRLARLAKELHIHRSESGKGGKTCLGCGRYFKPDDYVWKQMQPKTPSRRTPGDVLGHRHVACAPRRRGPSKKALAAAPKPLWSDDAA